MLYISPSYYGLTIWFKKYLFIFAFTYYTYDVGCLATTIASRYQKDDKITN